MKGKTMYLKKHLVLLVVAALVSVLTACGPATPTPAGTPAATQPVLTAAPPAATTAPATNTPSSPQVIPPIVGTPGLTTPKATAVEGQSPTPVPISGTPQIAGVPGAVTPVPSQTGTGPSIRILFPEDFASFHTTVTNRDILVVVNVVNFKLVDRIGQANAPGEGHIIYYLDANPPRNAGGSALTAPGTYLATTATSMRWMNVPSGPNKVAAQLVNNDNTPLSPPVFHQVQTYLEFNIGAPNVQIISPANDATVPAGNVAIALQIRDFVVTDKMGQPNLPGQGHIIYYMDADPPMVPGQVATTEQGAYVSTTSVTYTWNNVPPGVHTFAVQLVSNDNTPLGPPPPFPAVDKITVTVQ
jgi:hypothetical protein